jgi:hypothetical protein
VGITAPAALQTTWTGLSTAITASVTRLQTGGISTNEIQRLSFSGRAPVSGAISISLGSNEIAGAFIQDNTIFVLDVGDLFENRPVQLDNFDEVNGIFYMVNVTKSSFQIAAAPNSTPLEISGSLGDIFVLNYVIPNIAAPITSESIREAIIAAGVVNGAGRPLIEPSGNYFGGFNLEYLDLFGTSLKSIPAVSSTLAAAPALAANLSFNTNEVAALIAAGNTSNLRMEVEVSGGGRTQTYATAAAISPDIIDSTSPVPIPEGGTTGVLNFTDGSGGTWALSVDANGIVTTTKL